MCILRSALEDGAAGWAHPPGLLRCGGPSHLLGAHSLGLLSRLLGKESTKLKLCTDTGAGSALKPLVHPRAVPTLVYISKPNTCICPSRQQRRSLCCAPLSTRSLQVTEAEGTPPTRGLHVSTSSQPHTNLMLLQLLNVSS